jgi:solute carrier family 25 carnitine/acylcarnitine transporter 20/29
MDSARSSSYFVAYEVLKKRLTPAGSTDLSLPAVMAAGAGAGVAMWSIAIPPDVSGHGVCPRRDDSWSNELT